MNCDKQVPSNSDSKRVSCKHYLSSSDVVSSGLCMVSSEFLCQLDLNSHSPRLSHSSLTDWMDCKYKYYLRNIRGISIKNTAMSPAVKCGALWDVCMGVLLGQTDVQTIIDTVSSYEIEPRDVAKVKALYKAYKTLSISIDPMCKFQDIRVEQFNYRDTSLQFSVKGILDRSYPGWFAETKLSSKPDWYLNLFNITPQCGIYFVLDDTLEYVSMEVTRLPDLRSTGKFTDEDDQAYEDRCYKDILSRPAFYFQGYSKDTKTFGKKFYRSEFPLDQILSRLNSTFFEITWAADHDDFYKNYRSCYSPFQCDYLNLCHYDVMSEEIYTIKPKEGANDPV
jgi:hypothetical protein